MVANLPYQLSWQSNLSFTPLTTQHHRLFTVRLYFRDWLLSCRLSIVFHYEAQETTTAKEKREQKTRTAEKQKVQISKTTTLHVRIFVHFFAVVARAQRETFSDFNVLRRTWTPNNNFLFLSLNFDTVLTKSTVEKFAIICQIERDGKKATKFEVARLHFLSDVFVAVAVVAA